MRERGDGLGLALESGERFGVAGELVGQDLDRDVALQPRVARPVDLAHPARAERGEDLVGAEAGTGRQGHSAHIVPGAFPGAMNRQGKLGGSR